MIHYHKLDQWELFDLVSDPDEMQSVYGQPDYAGHRQRLTDELKRLRSELDVTSDDPPQLDEAETQTRQRQRIENRQQRRQNRRLERQASKAST